MNFDFAGLLADVFFPPICISCAKRIRRGVLCPPCHGRLIVRGVPLTALSDGIVSYLVGSAGNYENKTMQALIHALKFRGIQGAAEPLAEALCAYTETLRLKTGLDLSDFIAIPIPLSKQRERIRGFNQSMLIAKIFSERMGLPLEPDALIRVKHKKPQSETAALAERKENIIGCFTANADRAAGKNIIMIDDVTTSGATFLEAAKALTGGGAKKIIALAVARA